MSQASRSVRKIGWFLAANVALVLLLFTFGLVLRAMKIPVKGHPFLADIFGQHGLLFNFVLPLAVYLLIPVAVIGVVVWVVAALRAERRERGQ